MPVDIPKKNNFTLIRSVLALIVLVRHCMDSSALAVFEPCRSFFESQDAVCLFFVISGLLVTASYGRCGSLKSYAAKRLGRIFPLYLFTVFVAALVLCLASSLPAARYFTDSRFWGYLFWNSLTLNFMQRTLPGVFEANPFTSSVNDALWTIKIELFFYACLPFLCHVFSRCGGRRQRNLLLLSLYLLSFGYRQLCWSLSAALGIPLIGTLAMEAPGYFGAFLLGMACYYNFDRFASFLQRPPAFPCFAVSLSLIVLSNLGILCRIPDPVKYVFLSYACLYAAFSFDSLHGFSRGPDCSYAVYLFHFPLLQWMISRGLFDAFPWLSLFICAALTYVLAFAATRAEKRLFHGGKGS